jgi:hypothetical protein
MFSKVVFYQNFLGESMYKYLLPAFYALFWFHGLGLWGSQSTKSKQNCESIHQKTFDTEPQYANLKPVLSDLKLEMTTFPL